MVEKEVREVGEDSRAVTGLLVSPPTLPHVIALSLDGKSLPCLGASLAAGGAGGGGLRGGQVGGLDLWCQFLFKVFFFNFFCCDPKDF